MYQISLKGYFETEKPDELIEMINKAVQDSNSERIGQFATYQLAPYIDYQKADVKDPND